MFRSGRSSRVARTKSVFERDYFLGGIGQKKWM